ncbi:MAG TPA: hypothetical protein DCZ69_16425 [Syntrophobacteraceae bacterium]|nr:hypothetical protein [Syntrophobacteraceae bacterium]
MTEMSTNNIEKVVQGWSGAEMARRLMSLPAKKRLEAILMRSDSEAVIAALPAQDFYLTVMDLGPDDALPLLAVGRLSQLNLVFDLLWWRKDEILPGPALEWIERLARANPQNLLRWLYHADFELLVGLFGRWLRVAVVSADADLLEVRDEYPPHTLDDQYFWEACYPQYETQLRNILEFLFENHYGFYKGLMDHILQVTNTALLEDAFRFRRGRLEDLGIPDFYDALAVYQPLAANEICSSGKRGISPPDDADEGAAGFALALLSGGDLLDRGLRRIQDPATLLALQRELVALANKVVVADESIPEDADALRQAVDKVAAMVSLGLDLYTAGDEDLAVAALQEVFLENLFRLGFSQVARVRGRLQRLGKTGWLAKWPTGITYLDEPWKEAAELLLAKSPRILRSGLETPGTPQADLIRNRRDLRLANQTVDTIVALGILFEKLGADTDVLATELWQDGQARLLEDVTLARLIWTAAANQLWRGYWQALPLPVQSWTEVVGHLAPRSVEQTVRTWLDQQAILGTQRDLVESYLQPLFVSYHNEMAAVGGDGKPDPRYMELFLFRAD